MQICRDACFFFLTIWLVYLTFEVETFQGISCGSPGEVMNGRYDLTEGVEFGARVTAQCDKGHYIVGSKVRNCMAAGWSGRVVKCGAPPVVANGSLLYRAEESYAYREVVEYQCDRQLTLDGPRFLHCSETGQFEPNPPKCIDITCPTPNIDKAFRVEGHMPPYKYMSFIRYECEKGYEMEGESGLACEIDSRWSAPYPTCKVSKDSNPEAENVFFSKIGDEIKGGLNTFINWVSKKIPEVELKLPWMRK
ncbi:C4b-binding protein alpha chain-like isoform X2 [Oncorhynchus nerka]|uniref:C4b-binding protein alpha chain-like isoform X2 n=1 Tax=Oncorhynchus nerka TaxID=8023 RepID=UPI0031B87FBF